MNKESKEFCVQFYKMEVGYFNSEFSSPRGGEAVHYGCSMSTMSYLTFAMIGIYTAINVNNVSIV